MNFNGRNLGEVLQMVLQVGKDLGRWKITDGASMVAQLAKNLCAMQEILT